MKMELFGGLFWGVVLILFGISIIIKAIFNIDIPVLKFIFAMILIYLGITILFGKNFIEVNKANTIFNERTFKFDSKIREYNIIFGSGTMNMADIEPETNSVKVQANVIFGSGTILIKKGTAVKIKSNATFGESKLPNGNAVNFGEIFYMTNLEDETKPVIELETSCVFGRLEILETE